MLYNVQPLRTIFCKQNDLYCVEEQTAREDHCLDTSSRNEWKRTVGTGSYEFIHMRTDNMMYILSRYSE